MVTFKGGWSKLYYTQHTLLSNVGQLLFFFFFLKNKYIQERKKEFLTQRHIITPLKNDGNFLGYYLNVETSGFEQIISRNI